ncbi:hypothetical protein ELI_2471 [Eubacterium callanderi]|uniref:Uncharacterized protein n=1 Tax=Eubacterium callanderi TaxID=53442 RepID=E3GNW3_9FIRM|nr:hypothetical protein ELI_2471 [Eubacterium callanderi]
MFLFYFFTTLTKSLKALFLKVFPTPTLYFSEVKNHFLLIRTFEKQFHIFALTLLIILIFVFSVLSFILFKTFVKL